jgi:hypothetical protein
VGKVKQWEILEREILQIDKLESLRILRAKQKRKVAETEANEMNGEIDPLKLW